MSKKTSNSEGTAKKSFIDPQGRVLGFISIIDVVVLFAVMALCAGVYVKNNVLETTNASRDVNISMSFEVRIVPEYVADALKIGDAVYDKDHETGGAIGVITSIERTEPKGIAELTDGTVSYVTSNTDINLLVTVEGSGSVTDGRYSFNRIYEMGINSARNFQTKYAQVTGYVYEVKELT